MKGQYAQRAEAVVSYDLGLRIDLPIAPDLVKVSDGETLGGEY